MTETGAVSVAVHPFFFPEFLSVGWSSDLQSGAAVSLPGIVPETPKTPTGVSICHEPTIDMRPPASWDATV